MLSRSAPLWTDIVSQLLLRRNGTTHPPRLTQVDSAHLRSNRAEAFRPDSGRHSRNGWRTRCERRKHRRDYEQRRHVSQQVAMILR